MKTESQLNEEILKITNTIRSEFPELVKFLNEMPITIPIDNSPEINIQILEKYLNSLIDLVKNYKLSHLKSL
jgi:hypothetical protein